MSLRADRLRSNIVAGKFSKGTPSTHGGTAHKGTCNYLSRQWQKEGGGGGHLGGGRREGGGRGACGRDKVSTIAGMEVFRGHRAALLLEHCVASEEVIDEAVARVARRVQGRVLPQRGHQLLYRVSLCVCTGRRAA